MCIRLLCTHCSVRIGTFVHIIFYTHRRRRRRRSVAGSTRAIGVMKYRGPSRDVLVFFFSFLSLLYILSLLFCRTTRLPQPPRPARSWGAQQRKRYAIRFRASAFAPFDSLADRHRPAGQGRVRPEFARRDANTQIIRVYYYYY